MPDRPLLIALIAGVLQGIFEWLPISSEGNITLFLTAVGAGPEAALQFALFLHVGTAMSAAAYYRDEVGDVLRAPFDLVSGRTSGGLFSGETADFSFVFVATLASGVTGIVVYLTLDAVVTELAGGAFVALIGVLLVGTGILLKTADRFDLATRETPDLVDALLVGSLQGIALLPGVSRSGTTASALLFRGHDGPSAFRLSFLLSIPAAAGAGVLVFLDTGIPSVSPTAAAVAIFASATVGYLTIDALMRLVERVAFWGVCIGLGTLAIVGGGALVVTGA
ncbi:undecaprenyl-diphosphate phosphatase [Halomicrococcus sp. NG-SE-24]|uniref:undecaprenyl-diphosphate phosphatase n=1 Tax=Halomicrococcus sp. NG-SE-24 TaxID=3436928 RepID=UPI003D97C0DF